MQEAFVAELACISDDLVNSISTKLDLLQISKDITSTVGDGLVFEDPQVIDEGISLTSQINSVL